MELKIYNPQADGFLKAIDWNFEELKEEITKKSSDYLNLVYSDDQIKDAKQDRANLRKLVTALEDKRKEIKKEVMLPYEDFAVKEKELVEIINGAIENIDTQVKGYEEGLRQEKLAKVKEIYKECIGDLDRTIPFDKIFKESWLNVSTTLKSIKEEIITIREKIDGDLKIINAENSPYIYEMKEEYLKDFDLMAAMAKKQQLEDTAKKKALYEEQKKQEAEEKERKRKEEAARVELAGKVQSAPIPEKQPDPAGIVTQQPAIAESYQEQAAKLRRKRVEFNVGLAYGTLSDPNTVDKTAEEIKASKQRSYSTVSDIQKSLQTALEQLVYAMDVMAQLSGLSGRKKYEMSFDWDDSIVIDKEQELASMQQDAVAGFIRKELYVAAKYGVSEEEALKMMPQQDERFQIAEE